MEDRQLKKYAELLVRAGGNVQKNQPVVITSNVDDAYFARMVQDCAYDAGASEVVIDWLDDVSTRTRYLRAASETFDTFPQWRVDRFKYYDDLGAVYLHIRSEDPDLLAGVEPERIKRFTKASRTAIKGHTKLTMSNAIRWSLLAVPSAVWAKKVFPDASPEEACEKLWQCILKGARADGDNPIQDWAAHKANFKKWVAYLNQKAFKALRFSNSLGTDITIGLIKNHIWTGGGDTGLDGVPFFPNLPTEEIYTMPDKKSANGRVVASMPLSYNGNLIEDFEITFKNGRVIAYDAKKNKETLAAMIEMDEGSHYLGEVALVASSSPIAQMNTLFYNTLYDENASCHLALGKAYPNNVAGGTEMTEEEFAAVGGNDSIIHVDFMFGTADMKIIGISEDGSETVFYDNGEYL